MRVIPIGSGPFLMVFEGDAAFYPLVQRSKFGIVRPTFTPNSGSCIFKGNNMSSEYKHGEMDISEQQSTFEGFTTLVKWGTISCFILAAAAAWLTGVWYDGVLLN
jgi:hypothetical protein